MIPHKIPGYRYQMYVYRTNEEIELGIDIFFQDTHNDRGRWAWLPANWIWIPL